MMRSRKSGGFRGKFVPAAAAVILIAGVLGVFGLSQMSGAQSPPTDDTSANAGTPSPVPPAERILARSTPTQLAIPAIGVDGPLQELVVNADEKNMELPADPAQAGWYAKGPTPGEAGPTVIVGYIAHGQTPGVFQNMGALKSGDEISLTREDGATVTYAVDDLETYPVGQFPTDKVYESSKTSALRLVSCGGSLQPGEEGGNSVVFAHQVDVKT